MVMIPMIREIVDVPLIAAGGIASGKAIYAALALGADGVQMGSVFAASEESSAHPAFKKEIIHADDGDTYLALKSLVPVRLIKNAFFWRIYQAEQSGADKASLAALLGKGRAKKGMFEGDIEEGELEIGQVAGFIHQIKSVNEIMTDIIADFNATAERNSFLRLDI
jgi:enoyl-[acyl-carrier protein] reductase II